MLCSSFHSHNALLDMQHFDMCYTAAAVPTFDFSRWIKGNKKWLCFQKFQISRESLEKFPAYVSLSRITN